MLLNMEERRDIGLEYVFEKLQVMTPYGERRKAQRKLYRPGEEGALVEELEAVLHFTGALREKSYSLHSLQYDFCRLKDVSGSILRATRGAILDEVELFEIKGFARIIASLIEKLEDIKLPPGFSIKSLEGVERLLDPEATGLLTFYVYDSYSERLSSIRQEKRALEEKIYRSKGDKQEELLEERAQLVLEEEEEERQIRKSLSRDIASSREDFYHNMEALGKLDHWLAKAELSLDYGYCMPEITDRVAVELEEATSPLMVDLLKREMLDFQSLSMELHSGTTIVTGANMGGKSVGLKTLLLNVMLVHLGMLPFARKMTLGLLDFVFYLGDDYEDVRSGLSSFGAEVIKIRDILQRAESQVGLLVLDEPARGTNPREGRALVKGLAQHFVDKKSMLLMATHFDQIVDKGMVHYQIRGFEGVDFEKLRASAEFKERRSLDLLRSQMDYRLERVRGDREVPRDALRICALLGLDEKLIEAINQLL